jgi:hypothetical protein
VRARPQGGEAFLAQSCADRLHEVVMRFTFVRIQVRFDGPAHGVSARQQLGRRRPGSPPCRQATPEFEALRDAPPIAQALEQL